VVNPVMAFFLILGLPIIGWILLLLQRNNPDGCTRMECSTCEGYGCDNVSFVMDVDCYAYDPIDEKDD